MVQVQQPTMHLSVPVKEVNLGFMLAPDRCAVGFTADQKAELQFMEQRRFIRVKFEYGIDTRPYFSSMPSGSSHSTPSPKLHHTGRSDLSDGLPSPPSSMGSGTTGQGNVTRRQPLISRIRPMKYEMDIKFHDVEKGCIRLEKGNVLHIILKFPPQVWRLGRPNDSDPPKRRVVDIPKPNSQRGVSSAARPISPNPTDQDVRLGKWNVLRIKMEPGSKEDGSPDEIARFLEKAKEFNLYNPKMPQEETAVEEFLPKLEPPSPLPFPILYMLESARSHGCILDHDVTEELYAAISTLPIAQASRVLEGLVGTRKRLWTPVDYFRAESSRLSMDASRNRVTPHESVFLRKVHITPTTMYLIPPTLETSNRVTRYFAEFTDYFLRVEFSDEGWNKLASAEGSTQAQNAIYNRVFGVLTNGIAIGTRVYHFLAFSSSQLRDNAAWFFCTPPAPNNHITPDYIRSKMGDFSHIRSIAKYAARMGQCFSSTRAIGVLDVGNVVMIPEIERNGHEFSDGCGRISFELAKEIATALGKDSIPSAFQIRLGGAKGVLAVDKQVEGKRVEIRPSMKKFDVDHYVLEVIRSSSYLPGYLNRQIIILLSALGVPDDVFLKLKNNMIRNLDRILTDEEVAIKILSHNHDDGGTASRMIALIRAGFMASKDEYLLHMLRLFWLRMLDELAKKAKILVPKGAYLMGVVDETNTLGENEIYLKVPTAEEVSKHTVIEGDCVVVRCPCFHPGDVRVVKAVNKPRLGHLLDVVVFSTQGNRSVPNMCSGGDLDGDDYTVIWDPEIVKRVKEHPPMDYKGRNGAMEKDVCIHDIKCFFVQYATNNNLGIIANAHLALSDKEKMGPMDWRCLELAQLHSDAVDFPKSGVPAEMKPYLRPKTYPDFMEKSTGSYESKRIVGTIYRECGKINKPNTPNEDDIKFDSRMAIKGHEEFLESARETKALYDSEIRSLMNQYGVKSEMEVVSGFVLNFEIIGNARDHDIRKAVLTAFQHIHTSFRQTLEEEFYVVSKIIPREQRERLERKASAWYVAAYKDWKPGMMFSFPWVAWDILCQIARKCRAGELTSRPRMPYAPIGNSNSTATGNVDLLGDNVDGIFHGVTLQQQRSLPVPLLPMSVHLHQTLSAGQPSTIPLYDNTLNMLATKPKTTTTYTMPRTNQSTATPLDGMHPDLPDSGSESGRGAVNGPGSAPTAVQRPIRNQVLYRPSFSVTVQPDADYDQVLSAFKIAL